MVNLLSFLLTKVLHLLQKLQLELFKIIIVLQYQVLLHSEKVLFKLQFPLIVALLDLQQLNIIPHLGIPFRQQEQNLTLLYLKQKLPSLMIYLHLGNLTIRMHYLMKLKTLTLKKKTKKKALSMMIINFLELQTQLKLQQPFKSSH